MSEEILPRGKQTRTAILLAAHDLFVKQGYHGTAMRQIARRAGIALGGLYNHFPNKEAVFEAVFLAYHPYQQVLPYIQQAQGGTIEDWVRDALTRMDAAVRGRPDFLNLMFIEFVEFKSVHTQQLINTLLPTGLHIAQRLSLTEPEKMRPIPPPVLMRSFLGIFLAYFLTEIIFATANPPEFHQNALQDFVDIYLHGILIPASPGGDSQTPAQSG